jgi:hypothetical protein
MAARSTKGSGLEPVTGSVLPLVCDRPRTDVPGEGVWLNVAGPTDTLGLGVGVGLRGGVGVVGVGVGVVGGVGVGDDGHGRGLMVAPRVPAMAYSWPPASAVIAPT